MTMTNKSHTVQAMWTRKGHVYSPPSAIFDQRGRQIYAKRIYLNLALPHIYHMACGNKLWPCNTNYKPQQ